MQTVTTIEFNGQLRRIQAATPEDAVAELREEYEEAGPKSDLDLNTLSVHCVTGIDTYPTWDEFSEQFTPVRNHIDTNASLGGHMFQTYCEERCFVHAQLLEHIWTIAEDCTEDLIEDSSRLLLDQQHRAHRHEEAMAGRSDQISRMMATLFCQLFRVITVLNQQRS